MEFDSDSGRYDTVEFDSGMIVVFKKYIFGATIKVTKMRPILRLQGKTVITDSELLPVPSTSPSGCSTLLHLVPHLLAEAL